MYEIMRALVQREFDRTSGISIGRVESTSTNGYSAVNFKGQENDALAVTSLSGDSLQPKDTAFFVHLGHGQAPLLWTRNSLSVGGASPPVYEA